MGSDTYRVASVRVEAPVRLPLDTFIVFQGIIKGKGLQALVRIMYQILDKTRNVV